jgi:CHRD domain
MSMPRLRIVTAGMVVVTGAVTACGGSSSPPAQGSSSSGAASGTGATVTVGLTHVPHGQATLAYDGASRSMTVTIHLVGLAPDSTHPAHIHAGSCAKQGDVVYPLDAVIADAKGVATSTTRVQNVKEGGIPDRAWYVNVHNGPGLKPDDQFLPIACGDVTPGAGSSGMATSATVPLTSGPPPPSQPGSPDQAASGRATLGIVNGALRVTVDISGLAPNSSHAAHIHLGSCEAQGPVFKPLNSITADSAGHASVTTTISTVTAIPSRTWYINVHRTLNVAGSQTDFDPILCGDVGAPTGS